MAYRNESFDFCIDKGTFDALACAQDKNICVNLLKQMMRVCKVATVIVTSGTPEKRMNYFNQVNPARTEYHKIETSKLAQLINILRTELKDKPLSHALRNDPEILKKALKEMAFVQ